MSKKSMFYVAGIISIVLFILNDIGTYKLCRVGAGGVSLLDALASKFTYGCTDFLSEVIIILAPFIAIFLLSLITYKMRDEIFRAWIKFTYVWVPLTLVLTFLAPEYDSSLLPITKSVVSFGMSFLFLIISLIIIITKSISLKKAK